MSYHSHILNSSSHSHIIGRTDPITGDSVKENDRVVFCTVCKSCFLEDSWVYMNERHCEQNQTLDTIPALASRLVSKKIKDELITELKHGGVVLQAVLVTLVVSFLVSLSALQQTVYQGDTEAIGAFSILISACLGFIVGVITANDSFDELMGLTKNNVRLFTNRIEIGKESFVWSDIEQIKYQREMYVSESTKVKQNFSHIPFLLIYFNNDSVLKKNLATKSHSKTEKLLMGLEKISYFKNVSFYSENPQELKVMHNIKRNSKGKIEVGKPKKLLNY
ncbi:hypothetical protein [Bernardetia sp. MNP-M8]|uniref:hypothetical protein n=1 Tax=Bernardetia sp. MNP-M8 TaxID=3127470 RepID=UPI0030CBB394